MSATIRLTVHHEGGPFIIDRQMVADGTTPEAERQAIIDGIRHACAEAIWELVRQGEKP